MYRMKVILRIKFMKFPYFCSRFGKQQSGVGLVEILVTLLILSTSLIALGAMQNRSLQFNQSAYMRSQANIFAYDILDRMRINLDNIGSYNSEPAGPASSPVTSPLAAADLDDWRSNMNRALPEAEGGIECDVATSICTITITWRELNSSGKSEENETTFTYSARM